VTKLFLPLGWTQSGFFNLTLTSLQIGLVRSCEPKCRLIALQSLIGSSVESSRRHAVVERHEFPVQRLRYLPHFLDRGSLWTSLTQRKFYAKLGAKSSILVMLITTGRDSTVLVRVDERHSSRCGRPRGREALGTVLQHCCRTRIAKSVAESQSWPTPDHSGFCS